MKPTNTASTPRDPRAPTRDPDDARRRKQPEDPGDNLITNPLDRPGAGDNLIDNPLDEDTTRDKRDR